MPEQRLLISWRGHSYAFHWHLANRGIRHICIKPATSRLNGKVERSP
jgi:hypothetical protein